MNYINNDFSNAPILRKQTILATTPQQKRLPSTTQNTLHHPRRIYQTCGDTQTRDSSTVCGPGFLGDQAPVGLARKDGAGQLPPRAVLLAGQSRDSAYLSWPPGTAHGETEERVAVCGTGPGTPEAGLAHDRGHQGGTRAQTYERRRWKYTPCISSDEILLSAPYVI